MLGEVDLHTWDWDTPRCEIGFWLLEHAAGRGVATQVVQATTRIAFKEAGVERVQAICDAHNVRSVAVLERAGFTREAIMKHYERDAQGRLCDQCLYARLPER